MALTATTLGTNLGVRCLLVWMLCITATYLQQREIANVNGALQYFGLGRRFVG